MKKDKYDVFIAYTESDREIAQWFRRQMEDCKKFRVYFDLLSNEVGEIAAGLPIIDNCHAVLAIWSPEALKSDWVNCESAYAFAQKKIIPIALSNINNESIPDPLRSVHYAKFNFDDPETAQSNEVSPGNKRSWSKIIEKIDTLLGREAVPVDKNVECRVLFLDDRPRREIENIGNLLKEIGAKKNYQPTSLSDEAVRLGSSEDCESHFSFGLGFGEVADITVTANGAHDQSNIFKCIRDLDFLDSFDIIIVDMYWNESPDLFKEGVFKNHKSTNHAFEAEEVGMLLCEKIVDVLGETSNVPIVISTQKTIDSQFVAKALKYGAHSLISKRDEIALCNILLTVIKRKQRELIRSARVNKVIDSRG